MLIGSKFKCWNHKEFQCLLKIVSIISFTWNANYLIMKYQRLKCKSEIFYVPCMGRDNNFKHTIKTQGHVTSTVLRYWYTDLCPSKLLTNICMIVHVPFKWKWFIKVSLNIVAWIKQKRFKLPLFNTVLNLVWIIRFTLHSSSRYVQN